MEREVMQDTLVHMDVLLVEKTVAYSVSPKGLNNTSAPQVGWGPGVCILHKLPGALADADGAAFWNHQPR